MTHPNQLFLSEILELKVSQNTPLSKFTTWRIGGPAEILVETENSNQLELVLKKAKKYDLPVTILGNGSNILISDVGLQGVVIINKSKVISLREASQPQATPQYIPPRHSETGDSTYYSFGDLDYTETAPSVQVSFDSGVMLPYAINWTLKNNLTGLQWFAGIPGTIGGSLYNNIHGGTKHFSDNFLSAKILDQDGEVREVGADFFHFGYDQSILRTNSQIFILEVTLNLLRGDAEKAKYVAKEWLKRKSIQPKNSCGSVFQALDPEIQKKLGYPTPSIGYILDKILNLKGTRIGDIQISETHANFMVNLGQASGTDTLNLIKKVKSEVKKQLNIDIHPEINFLGFTKEELEGVR